MSACRSCGKPVVWAKVQVTGSPIPLDPDPAPNGNIRLHTKPECEVLSQAQIKQAKQDGVALYVSHFATCPEANRWRKR